VKSNGKQASAAQTSQDNAQASQTSTAAAAPAGDTGAVVQPAPAVQASQAIPPDEHHGRGGAYTRVDGKRVRVTEAAPTTTEGENSNGN
jgi:hypothetical protein